MSERGPLKRALLATPVGRPLLNLKRRFDAPEVKRDREDNELLLALLADVLEPDANCVDVGAHEGAILAEMARLAPRGKHVAFEPLPALAQALRARFPHVDVRQAAASDRDGAAEFVHVTTRPGWSGFRERPYPGDEHVERIEVRTERLDDVLTEPPALIKIDVEGAELQVIEGAERTLRDARPVVVFEHGLGSADHYGTTPANVWRALSERADYEIGGLDGDGPYPLQAFERIYARRERVNFVARPRSP
jgi:FkbM family methyltransferase